MIKAKKHLGQNFLISEKALNRIVTTANLSPTDFVLEIGPGTGNLTKLLYQKTKNLLCLEKDPDMLPLLEEFPVQEADALQFDPKTLPKNYKIVANIPYYITSPLINRFLKEQFIATNGNPPALLVLLVQKEVAEKICNHQKQTFLSINIQNYAKPSLIATVKKGCFRPIPAVDSAILKLEVYPQPLAHKNLPLFSQITSLSFQNSRKKLKNNLKPYYQSLNLTYEEYSKKVPIDLNLRAENLTPQDFEQLII